jgi:polyhydroxybutyrate depolymerase
MKNIFRRTVNVFIWLIFISALLGIQSAFPQSEPPIQVGENSRSIMSGNQTRQYLLYIPAGYDGKTSLPLVLLFHGTGGSPKGVMELTDLSKVAEKKKFIIAAPKGIFPLSGRDSWNFNLEAGGVNDVEFVKDLIREISAKVAIDKKRIYSTGFSDGARMSSRLACEIPNAIAAIGAVAGLQFPHGCAKIRPVPVIVFHGTADSAINVAEALVPGWVEHNGCNKTPTTRKISEDVTQISYGGCQGNAEVIFYHINKGGHVWPDSPIADRLEKMGIWKAGETNKDINATNLIWNFFETHPMP